MKQGRKRWGVTLYGLAVCSFFLFFAGFVLALNDFMEPEKPLARANPAPRTEAAGHTMLVGLGDSLTRGIGDDEGLGYFGLVRQELLRNESKGWSAVNLAISGQTSNQLAAQVFEPRVRDQIQKARWITITIGGNDLFRGSGRLEHIDLNGAEKSRLAFERNLIIILEELRKQNPTATIYLFGLYNPFGDLPEGPEAARLIGEWNATMTDVAARFNKVVVVPTSDLFQLNPRAYLYSDHFHPNARGYALMAERLMQLMPELQGGEK